MKTTRTFKTGTEFPEVTHWIEGTIVELLGDSAPTLLSTIRVTVQAVKADELAVDPILEVFGVTEAKEAVMKFLEFRQDDLRKPMTLEGVRRAIRPFANRSRDLIASIEQSIRHGWSGLFESKGEHASASREWKGGERKGGAW